MAGSLLPTNSYVRVAELYDLADGVLAMEFEHADGHEIDVSGAHRYAWCWDL